jgi:hypothetical protein
MKALGLVDIDFEELEKHLIGDIINGLLCILISILTSCSLEYKDQPSWIAVSHYCCYVIGSCL